MTTPLNESYPEERRLATVMFADLQGFTILAERLDYETVSTMLKAIWHRLDHVILEHGGHIDKHLGDGVMVLWGAPHAVEDDVEQALSAAIDMHQALAETIANYDPPQVRELRLRIGINTGMVLATYVGYRNEYTVIGDTVNIASRLEEAAEPGTTMVSESTFRSARGAFRMHRLKTTVLRGKTEPLTPYVLEERLEQPSRIRYKNVGGLETVMVGRDEEWTQLMSLYRGAQASFTPTLGLIMGEIGLGKSRLLMEFSTRIEAEDSELTLLSARGLAQAEKSPFFMWKSLWKDRFQLTDDLPEESAREKFLRGILSLWGNRLGPVSAVEAAHLIGDLIGISWQNSPFVSRYQDSPALRVQRAFEMSRELLARIADRGPTILLLDDLQWMDKGSLDLLAYLVEPSPRPLPILILGSARPELIKQQIRWANLARVIQLKPVAFTPRLIRQAYPVMQSAPASLLKQLSNRSDGNPYYLEEMVKNLVLSLTPEGSRTMATDQSTGEIKWPDTPEAPPTLRTLLQSRLDAIPREARDVALLASVVGRVFWEGAIMAAAQQPVGTGLLNLPPEVLERVLKNAMRHLVHAELAFPRAGSIFANEKEYIFKHSLLREVAYSLLPIKYRQHYHYGVATWLANRAGPDFQVMVAEHFEIADDRSRAIRHFQAGQEYAVTRGANEEAAWIHAKIKELRGTSQK